MTIAAATPPRLLLVKSVYGLETDPKKTPFGLLNGQMRTDAILNNAGWFNLAGEKIGYGDISMSDMNKISAAITVDECFFILTEFDTVWNMPKDMSVNEPGKDYVLKHCAWAVSKGSILKVRDATTASKTGAATLDGVEYTKVIRSVFQTVITKLFYTKKTNIKHALLSDIKTDGMDEIIKNNLKQMQKLIAPPASKYATNWLAAPAPANVLKPITKPATNPIAAPAIQAPAALPVPKIPLAKPPVKVKRATP